MNKKKYIFYFLLAVCTAVSSVYSSPRYQEIHVNVKRKTYLADKHIAKIEQLLPHIDMCFRSLSHKDQAMFKRIEQECKKRYPRIQLELARWVVLKSADQLQETQYLEMLDDKDKELFKELYRILFKRKLYIDQNNHMTRGPRPQSTVPIIRPAVSAEMAQAAVLDNSLQETVVVNNIYNSGGGGVKGPSFSTDKAIARYEGNDGDHIQNSGVIIADDNTVTGVNRLECQDIDVLSDISLKDDIQRIDKYESLEKILKLQPVVYRMIMSAVKNVPHHERGLIAQAVQEVLPELVHEKCDGLLSISYQKLVVDLIGAVQALEAEIQELKGKL